MLFRFLLRRKLIQEIPEIRDLDPIIAKKKKARPVGRVYSDDEISSLLNACESVGKHRAQVLRLELYILFGRQQGRRQMEVLASEWANNDVKIGISKVWSFKNKKWRDVPIPVEIDKRLKELRSLCPTDTHIFPGKNPKTYSVAQVYNRHRTRVKEKAQLKNWDVRDAARYHDLRHTFATQTVNDGWPVRVACETLDMSIRVYERTYTHIKGHDIKRYMRESFGVVK